MSKTQYIMKTIKIFVALLLMVMAGSVQAQTSGEIAKKMGGFTAIQKAEKQVLNKKVAKELRKQIKQWKKEGWKTMPGQLSLERQMERSVIYQYQFEDDDELMPKYVWGDAASVAQVYDAGKDQALELARQRLAGQIENRMAQIAENKTGNDQTSREQVTSLVNTIRKAKSIVETRLGQTIPVVEAYRELKDGRVEVRVQTFYNMNEARRITREAVRQQMEKDGQMLTPELENLMK